MPLLPSTTLVGPTLTSPVALVPRKSWLVFTRPEVFCMAAAQVKSA
jgi:hypothetical protein